jgi:hypothetical protein
MFLLNSLFSHFLKYGPVLLGLAYNYLLSFTDFM